MAACDGEERGHMSLLQSLENRLRCGECHEDKEDLIVLRCCQYSCCQQCIDAKRQCQAYGCDRLIDFCCKNCKTFLCFRCKDLPCDDEDNPHNAVDTRDCVLESKETFELWKGLKLQNIAELNLQKQEIVKKIKLSSQQLVDVSDGDSVCEILERISTEMSTANRDLQDNKMEMEQEVCSLNLMEKLMNNASGSEIELIHLVEQLQVFDYGRCLVLGPYEPFGTDRKCYDISISPAGHLVAGGVAGLDILQIDTGECVRTIPLDDRSHAFTVAPYKDLLFVGVTEGNEGIFHSAEMMTYDMEYNEIRRWQAPKKSLDHAVVDDHIFITEENYPFNPEIKAFNLDGTHAPDILWNGSPSYVASIPPCSIVFGDGRNNQVCKYNIASGRRAAQWSTTAIVPRCITLDEKGCIWIRSNQNNSFTILSRYGDLLQEIKDDATRFIEISGMCIHKGYLYIAHDDGVGRFKLNWQTPLDQ